MSNLFKTQEMQILGMILGIIIVIILIVLILIVLSRHSEKRLWNKGYCKCGNHWRLNGKIHHGDFDEKKYICDNCHRTCLITYEVDKLAKK